MLGRILRPGICSRPGNSLSISTAARSFSRHHDLDTSVIRGESSSSSESQPDFRGSRASRTDTDDAPRPYRKPRHKSVDRNSRHPDDRYGSENFRERAGDQPSSRNNDGQARGDRSFRGRGFREFNPERRKRSNLRKFTGGLQGHLYDNYTPISSSRNQVVARPSNADPSFDLLDAIRTAFPHVKTPTPVQTKLIPAIVEGHDVILNDETGSGKTFGSVIALLSELGEPYSGTTTVYLVPHRDLAYQIESWCQRLLAARPSASTPTSPLVKVLARPNVTFELLGSIEKNPPRILIATPGGLLEAVQMRRLSLPITLRRIVIDEVDAVMNIPARYGPKVRMDRRHRPEAAQFIDWVLESMWRQRVQKPQMILMSATLRVHVRRWLFQQKRWLNERVIRIDAIKEKLESGELNPEFRTAVVHSAVVVESDGSLRNMEDEPTESRSPVEEPAERGILTQDPEIMLEMLDREGGAAEADTQETTKSHPPKGFILPPSVLEAIATSVALDVTDRALLVVPNGVSVLPVVDSLKDLGVDARLLNFLQDIKHVSERLEPNDDGAPTGSEVTEKSTLPSSEPEEPTEGEEYVPDPMLLVATASSVPGVDIPTLSHVYIVGGARSEESYRHIAGRTGRFGKPGTVVSFVGAEGAEGILGSSFGERRLQKIYARIGIERVPFAHIQ